MHPSANMGIHGTRDMAVELRTLKSEALSVAGPLFFLRATAPLVLIVTRAQACTHFTKPFVSLDRL